MDKSLEKKPPMTYTDEWWGYIIRKIVDDQRLTTSAKMLYLHIAESIANRDGWDDLNCYKSNSELAADLNFSTNAVSAFVSKLYKLGYINREIYRDENNILRRKIWLLEV